MNLNETPSFPLRHVWVELRTVNTNLRVHWKTIPAGLDDPESTYFMVFDHKARAPITEVMHYDEFAHWLMHANMVVDFWSEKQIPASKLTLKLGEPRPAFREDRGGFDL